MIKKAEGRRDVIDLWDGKTGVFNAEVAKGDAEERRVFVSQSWLIPLPMEII
ncbi:hypothetical protein Mic7113_4510 [Allocoleopsis franciscana PCC 7113]|uniref:Uncharacterized protein n=1 Tax=Allocoleopsis franciscana PCC 7113 TaxID=1173027 RepID=K9WK60_9CYAN|nr:hypothetical protein Mic7113_4510 [Allocoleopsis franciscana PCC 7113]